MYKLPVGTTDFAYDVRFGGKHGCFAIARIEHVKRCVVCGYVWLAFKCIFYVC